MHNCSSHQLQARTLLRLQALFNHKYKRSVPITSSFSESWARLVTLTFAASQRLNSLMRTARKFHSLPLASWFVTKEKAQRSRSTSSLMVRNLPKMTSKCGLVIYRHHLTILKYSFGSIKMCELEESRSGIITRESLTVLKAFMSSKFFSTTFSNGKVSFLQERVR